jgi:hypothetical protein
MLKRWSSYHPLFTVKSGGSLRLSGSSAGDKKLSIDGGAEWLGGDAAWLAANAPSPAHEAVNNSGITANDPLIIVKVGGTLTMKDGAILTNSQSTRSVTSGSTNDYEGGGAVFVHGGKFFMEGGEINNCQSVDGGGVYVGRVSTPAPAALGEFIMSGGRLFANYAVNNGGGAYVWYGTITLMGTAEVAQNSVNIASNYGGGGLTTVQGEIIVSENASIRSNKAKIGGGIYSEKTDAKLIMTGGHMDGNTAENNVGAAQPGAEVYTSCDMVISGGVEITGGDVYLYKAPSPTTSVQPLIYVDGPLTAAARAISNLGGNYITSNHPVIVKGTWTAAGPNSHILTQNDLDKIVLGTGAWSFDSTQPGSGKP